VPELQVRKRDGSTEPFMRDKVYNGVVKSGATPEQAEKITAQLESMAPSISDEGVVPTDTIADKVVELLGAENPAAAENFETYRKEKYSEVEVPAVPEQ
jgi:transcriptional regulator NrdR family protein